MIRWLRHHRTFILFTVQGNENCNYFTFYEPNQFCKLLYNCSDIDANDCPDSYTGQKDCQICDQPGECVGSFVDDSFLPTKDDCQKECFNNDECLWYTYDYDFDYCLLTSDCLPMNKSAQKVFGQQSCYDSDIGGTSCKKTTSSLVMKYNKCI